MQTRNTPQSRDTAVTDRNQTTNRNQEQKQPKNVTIVGGNPNLFRQCSENALTHLVTEFDPDAYFLTGTTEPYTGATQIKYELPTNSPVLYPGNAQYGKQELLSVNNIDIVICTEFDDLYDIQRFENNGQIDTSTETIILSNLLSLDVQMSNLQTQMVGLHRYKQSLQPDQLQGSYTHVSGSIKAGYCREWDNLTIYGAGIGNGQDGSRGNQFISITISPEGYINNTLIDSHKLGLQAIETVGPKTAGRLKEHGFDSQEKVAIADLQEITGIKGIADTKAQTIKKSAKALTENKVIHTSTNTVPGDDPLFIDIETDGLNPTRVWLIGVKNGIDGNHMSFIETKISENGEAVTAFMMWLQANASEKTLIAWNGWNFDFPVIREHIQEHCPQYLSLWQKTSKRDPLRWARDLDNAILPGRTNKLEDVANALGWEGHQTSLSGAEVARRMRNWLENPCEQTELDWELHKQYCKDDVDALAHIYKEMKNSNRIESETTESIDIEEETVQGGLFDSY